MAFVKGQSGNPKGRARKSEVHAGAVARAEKQIRDRLPELVDNMIRLANGVTVQEVDKDGGLIVFTQPPDYKALAYLIDRIMGKPTERKEISGPDSGPIPFHYADTIADLAGGSDGNS
jgi:Family of unknown function (DUF5681)